MTRPRRQEEDPYTDLFRSSIAIQKFADAIQMSTNRFSDPKTRAALLDNLIVTAALPEPGWPGPYPDAPAPGDNPLRAEMDEDAEPASVAKLSDPLAEVPPRSRLRHPRAPSQPAQDDSVREGRPATPEELAALKRLAGLEDEEAARGMWARLYCHGDGRRAGPASADFWKAGVRGSAMDGPGAAEAAMRIWAAWRRAHGLPVLAGLVPRLRSLPEGHGGAALAEAVAGILDDLARIDERLAKDTRAFVDGCRACCACYACRCPFFPQPHFLAAEELSGGLGDAMREATGCSLHRASGLQLDLLVPQLMMLRAAFGALEDASGLEPHLRPEGAAPAAADAAGQEEAWRRLGRAFTAALGVNFVTSLHAWCSLILPEVPDRVAQWMQTRAAAHFIEQLQALGSPKLSEAADRVGRFVDGSLPLESVALPARRSSPSSRSPTKRLRYDITVSDGEIGGRFVEEDCSGDEGEGARDPPCDAEECPCCEEDGTTGLRVRKEPRRE